MEGDMIVITPPVTAKAAKVIADVKRRYNYAGETDDNKGWPVIDVPEGAEITIDGIWDGGHLSAHWQGNDFPASADEVEPGLYKRLWRKYSGPRIKCPDCEGGWRVDWDEHTGQKYRDACYHCGNTGFINEEQYFADRLRGIAATLSWRIVQARIAARNSAEFGGENWAFCAAENGMHEHEYTQLVQMGEEDRVVRVLGVMAQDGNGDIIRAIVDLLAPPDPKVYVKDEEPAEGDKPPEDAPPVIVPDKVDLTNHRVRANQDFNYLIPAKDYDKEGATHRAIRKGQMGTVVHDDGTDEVAVEFNATDYTVYCHRGQLDDLGPKPAPVAVSPSSGYTDDDIPF
jgi:hypothetical protein